MIEPSVGRIVHFYPGGNENIPGPGPLAAVVTHVNNDRDVNLRIFGTAAGAWTRTNVRLLQDQDQRGDNESVAKWMPYQLGQASATQEANTKAQGALDKQKLYEFYTTHLRGELDNRNLLVAGPEFSAGGKTMTVMCQGNGHSVPCVVPVELVAGDGKKAVIASNLAAGVVKEIEAMMRDDGKQPPPAPAVPPAPSTEENFGGA